MTIDELIEAAQDTREDLGGDAQIRIASQPGYPLRAAVGFVTVPPSTSRPGTNSRDETAAGQQDGTFPVARHRRPPRLGEPLRSRVGVARPLHH